MLVALLVAVTFASAAILAFIPLPFLWIALLWAAALSVLAVRHTQTLLRILWINLAVVMITLGALELYFHSRETKWMAGSVTEGFKTEHQILGYGPVPGRESRAIKYHGGELVYDVNYNIDSRGLRVSPPALHPPPCGSVLLFGGSVTFGEGVEDDQTMPYLTGVKTGGRYSIYNFGFSGYGPHQMLAALQGGVTDQVVKEPVSYVIYQGIPAHVARTAGRAIWDPHGPRYVLDDSGFAIFTGAFDGGLPWPLRWLHTQLNSSALYRWLGSLQRRNTPEDIALYTAVVVATREAVIRKFPAAEFHVLLWGYPGEKTYEAMRAGLHRAGVNVHPISEILTAYTRDPATYVISPFDLHPNPRAHERIAAYVSTHILQGGDCRHTGRLKTAADTVEAGSFQ